MNEDIRNKIKKVTIYTKRISKNAITGDYLSAFKGTGLEFDQLREYNMGDDIRFIDWNSSAKMNKMMVKQFVEERDRTIILAIDISASSVFSSNEELRESTISNVATTLAFISTHNKDKVGALFFSDKIEKWIAPKKGRSHFGKIVEHLFSIKATNKKTDISQALSFLISLKKKNSVVFLLSDWIDDTDKYSKLLKVASIKFDLIGMRFLDACEHTIPKFGFLDIQDPETGESITIDTRKENKYLKNRQEEQEKLFSKNKIDLLDLQVGKPFVNKIIKFLHKRIRRQVS